MDVKICLLLLLAAALAFAMEAPLGRRVRYFRAGPPKEFTRVGRTHPDKECHFSLALPQRNMDVLEETVLRISNPKDADYGKWLTKQQIFDLIGTPRHIVEDVRSWLFSVDNRIKGLRSLDFTGDSFLVSCSCAYAEALFQTEIHDFHNFDRSVTVSKHFGSLSVPEELDSAIELITGITDFSPARLEVVRSSGNALRQQQYCNTPPSMRELYNMSSSDVASSSVSQAPFAQASQPDGFGVQSLQTFQSQCAVPNNPVNRTLGSGQYIVTYDDGEANLDMEMITTFGVGATTDFFVVDESKGWMYEYTQELISTPNPPHVNSMSYAWNEDQQCSNSSIPFVGHCTQLNIPNSKVYVNRTNGEFMKLTGMGLTFLAASGDGGTDGNHGGDSCQYTHPLFPASSPWVVSVGATVAIPGKVNPVNYNQPICSGQGQLSCDCNQNAEEVVCMLTNYGGFDTGGGFSYFATQPSWQASAVNNYFASGVQFPPAGAYHKTGRGYPDVAAIGGAVAVIADGSLELVGGTSASTPLVAGMISTMNSMRIAAGKSPLGFVNQVLYQAAAECSTCFNDITQGNNGNLCQAENMGFYATTGWDACTGLGSINFAALSNYVVNQVP